MQKKVKCGICFITLFYSIFANAGAYKPIMAPPLFLDIEGGYTWTALRGVTFNNFSTVREDKGGTGRIAAGATHWVSDSYGYTGEFGWGYYGKSSRFFPFFTGYSETWTYSGMDFLVGLVTKYNDFSFFLKLGGMVQTNRLHKVEDFSRTVQGNTVSGVNNDTLSFSNWAPELKVMGAYAVDDKTAITLSYLNVFGNRRVYESNQGSGVGGVFSFNRHTVGGPIAFYTVLAGIHHTFG